VRYILEAVAGGLEMSLSDGQIYEATLFGLVSTTDDMREGTRAFLEKRKAAFQGR
jgi:enoyl-CoA hydratase